MARNVVDNENNVETGKMAANKRKQTLWTECEFVVRYKAWWRDDRIIYMENDLLNLTSWCL